MNGMTNGVIYTCVKCGTAMTMEDLENRGGSIKCIQCGYKVLQKIKPPVVHSVKAI